MHDSLDDAGLNSFPAQPYTMLKGHLWTWLALMKTFWRPLPHILQMVEEEKRRLGWEWPIITVMVRRGSTMDNVVSKLKKPELELLPPWGVRDVMRRNFSHEYGLEPYLRAADSIRQRYGINRVHLITDDVPIYEDVATGKYAHTGFRFSVQRHEEVAANYLASQQPGSQVVRNAELLSEGSFFIGPFSSCYARLVYQIMLLKGRPHEAGAPQLRWQEECMRERLCAGRACTCQAVPHLAIHQVLASIASSVNPINVPAAAISVDASWFAVLANTDFGRFPADGWPGP